MIEPPKFTTTLPGSKILKNENAVLYCEAEGYPAPEIRWLKNGYDITDSNDSHWTIVSERHDERFILFWAKLKSIQLNRRFFEDKSSRC